MEALGCTPVSTAAASQQDLLRRRRQHHSPAARDPMLNPGVSNASADAADAAVAVSSSQEVTVTP